MANSVHHQNHHLLTLPILAADCAKKKKTSSNKDFLWFLIAVCYFGCGFLMNTSNSYETEKIFRILLVLAGLGLLVICIKHLKANETKHELAAGKFYFIRSPLEDTEEKIYGNAETETYAYYFYFNSHNQLRQYRIEVSFLEYRSASRGEEFYLVLKENAQGGMNVLKAYPVKTTPLDLSLQEILKRDQHLTGLPFSREKNPLKNQTP